MTNESISAIRLDVAHKIFYMKYSFHYKLNGHRKDWGKRLGIVWLASLLVVGTLPGCKKILDVNSTHAVNEANMWNSHEDTRTALIGVYGLMRAALANDDAYWMYGELRDGDFVAVQRQDLKAIIAGRLAAPYPVINDLSNWRRFYAVINAANMFLEHVGEVKARDPKYTDQNMRVDIAQMRFMRALSYFFLVRIWGDVPLITTSHDGDFTKKARDPAAQVLAFVTQETQTAANDLPYAYSSNDPLQQGNYYNESSTRWMGALARKISAYALLAHVAAWQGKYADVVVYTKFIMDNYSKGGHYFLSTDELTRANGFFDDKQANQILGFNFVWGHADASYSGHLEELTLAAPLVDKSQPDIYIPKNTILSIFNQPNDERFSLDTLTGIPNTEDYFTNFNRQYPIFDKIKVLQDGNLQDGDFRIYGSTIILTRMEELSLLRAEALVVVGDDKGAIDLLNQIRDLRKLGHYDATKEGDLLDAIFLERRKELMGEGWRWYDLVRYNKLKQNNPAFMELINKGGIYWPVSQDVIAQNDQITQNSYWK